MKTPLFVEGWLGALDYALAICRSAKDKRDAVKKIEALQQRYLAARKQLETKKATPDDDAVRNTPCGKIVPAAKR